MRPVVRLYAVAVVLAITAAIAPLTVSDGGWAGSAGIRWQETTAGIRWQGTTAGIRWQQRPASGIALEVGPWDPVVVSVRR